MLNLQNERFTCETSESCSIGILIPLGLYLACYHSTIIIYNRYILPNWGAILRCSCYPMLDGKAVSRTPGSIPRCDITVVCRVALHLTWKHLWNSSGCGCLAVVPWSYLLVSLIHSRNPSWCECLAAVLWSNSTNTYMYEYLCMYNYYIYIHINYTYTL